MINDKLALMYTIAENAKNHARTGVIQGSTQLVNNQLEEEFRKGHKSQVKSIRLLCGELPKVTHDVLEANEGVLKYERLISTISKYSIGNCHELALLAFDYVLNNHPNVSAEVFRIKNGDHVFLVINRKPFTSKSKPLEWGDDAVICDPWSNKIFLAKDYLTELECFYRDDKDSCCTEKFNPGKHKIMLLEDFELFDNLVSARTTHNLLDNYKDYLQQVKQVLNLYDKKLKHPQNRLKAHYTNDDEKVKIVKEIRANIKMTIKRIDKNISDVDQGNIDETNYRKLKSDLFLTCKEIYQSAINSMQPNSKEQEILFAPREYERLMRFFKIKTDTYSDFENAASSVNEQLKNLKP